MLRGLAAQGRIPGLVVLCRRLAWLKALAFVQRLFRRDATPKRAATVRLVVPAVTLAVSPALFLVSRALSSR